MFSRRPYWVTPFCFDRALFCATLVLLVGCGGRAGSTFLPPEQTALGHGTTRLAQSVTPSVVSINVAGPAVGTFVADIDGAGGTISTVTNPVDTSAANAAPAAVYQTQRYGVMTYTIPNLTPGAAYITRLHFAETYFGLAGRLGPAQRMFNVAVNGASALTNFDVFAAAGGSNIAVVKDIVATANGAGKIAIAFTNGTANNPIVNGIEIIAAPVTAAVSINVGGPATGAFAADVDGTGGAVSTSNDTFDLSAANAAPAVVYQTQRYGNMTYAIPGLTPATPYTVRLHFMEQWWGVDGRAGGIGSRKFNVAINGANALTNYDVFAVAGGDKAVVSDFPATADANGKITIVFANGAADNAMVSAIQIMTLSGALATPSPAPTAAPTLAPTPAPAPTPFIGTETARSSDAFVDAAGVNVHLAYAGSVYGTNFPVVQTLLQNAGFRHIRDGAPYGQTNICNEDVALAAHGIHVDVVAPSSMTGLTSWLTCIGAAAESVEGYNEYDNSGDPNWASVLRIAEPLIAAASPLLPQIAPALTSENAYVTLGSMASMVSFGNSHAYFAGNNPGTVGWGGTDAFGTYGSLAWNLAIAGQVSGSKPMDVTESGYSDQTDQYAVPAVTKARYAVRTYLNNWIAGVNRTYLYELADEGGTPFSHYGLVDAAGNPKPAYTAVVSLLAHLSDPGAAFTSAPLNFTFASTATVRHTVLEKRNGTYEVIFWNEVSEWSPNANAPVATTAQPVTLTFVKAPASMTQTTFADSGSVSTASLAGMTSITLSAGAWPTIVDIVP